ncbi:MAG: MotA/TolQ/ExbB proton channel family protein [Spirochaetales bacterium]|nr:MAG: MotA/TolQ/ExbB proton channel family protein [Spirochaetales bacterium]
MMRAWTFMQKGGPVMWPLLACLFFTLWAIIERGIFLLGGRRNPDSHIILSPGEYRAFKRSLGILELCTTLSPLLGILGTVTGIIRSFNALGITEVPDLQQIGKGIAEALTTTAAGLIIAAVAIIGHSLILMNLEEPS